MKLRTKTIIFFGAFLLILAGCIIFYAEYIVGGALRDQTIESLRIEAEQAEGSYYTFLNMLKRQGTDWVADHKLQDIALRLQNSKVGTQAHLQAIADFSAYVTEDRMPHDKSIMMADILDKSGIVVASTVSDRIGINEAQEEARIKAHHFNKAIASTVPGEAFIKSIVFESDETPEPMIHVTVRLFAGDNKGSHKFLDEVLLIHFLSIGEIADVLSGEAQIKSGALTGKALLASYKTSEIYIVNSNQDIVTPTRYTPEIKYGQKNNTLPVEECLKNNNEISQEYDDYRGVRVWGASMCLPSEGLVLLVEINKDELFAPTVNLINTTILFVILFFIFGAGAVSIFLKRPLSYIDKIVAGFERLVRGDFSVNLDIGTKDEIGYLTQMFNKMVKALKDNQQSLQASKNRLEENEMKLTADLVEHEKQEKFLEGSRRATQSLLEDSWKIKEKAQEEERHLQTIITSVAEGLLLIDGTYRVALVNPVAASMFGMTREEVLGKDLRTFVTLWKKGKDILPPEMWPIEQVFLTKKIAVSTLEDGFSITTEKHPEKLPVVFSIAPVSDTDAGAVIVIRDITKDRELDEAKSGFISVASHQLRTPLTSIRWYSEMLLSEDAGPLNDTQKDFMKEVHSGAERLYQTVDLLLGLSRVENGKLKNERTPIDLTAFTSEIQKELSSQASEKSLTFNIAPPERSPVVVWLDPLTLRQVVLNLISNAIRYTNEHGKVEVTWQVPDNQKEEVIYSVHDDGIGIPKNAQSQVFSKFFRAENARAQIPDGSGLGLALVKELVESWGGKVWFETTEGQGTTFFFTVPLSTKVADTPENARIGETK